MKPMKKLIIVLIYLLFINNCFGQITKKNIEEDKIKITIIKFLNWHKNAGEYSSGSSYFVPRYNDLDTTITNFDQDSLERYYNGFRKSKFVSERYINQLKDYFNYYGKYIGPKPKPGEIVKIDGLDQDIILNTLEPEIILDNIGKAVVTKSLIIYDKALIGINFKNGVDMIFILTKENKAWVIDYLGADNTNKNSFFRQ